MNQRLFFLFPDRDHTLSAVEELIQCGFRREDMHSIANSGVALDGLPLGTAGQMHDHAAAIEFWGWRINLLLFFAAAAGFAALLLTGATWGWLLLPLAVMAATLLAGLRFARTPNVHVSEFRDALAHGEILLMVDVPQTRVHEVENRVQQHHPEAVPGGSSWNIPALGV
ncbi:MAG: hypothetical protein J5I92_16535 [Thiogranum sp.]|nr:hypothetical protein [Thiogranum sp.]